MARVPPVLSLLLTLTINLALLSATVSFTDFHPVYAQAANPSPLDATVQVTLDFEDRPPSPDLIHNQYLGAYGVAFDAAQIIASERGTSSGSQALRASGFQSEFHQEPLILSFAAAQSQVSMRVGLVQSTAAPVHAVLQAYNSAGVAVGQPAGAWLGPGPTAVTTLLQVSHPTDIREVRLHYVDTFLFEAIDDLTFAAYAPPNPEQNPPQVQIWSPASGELLMSAFFQLVGTIEEESPLANVQLSIAQGSATIASYQIAVTGGPPVSNIYGFGTGGNFGALLSGQNTITVVATDIYGNTDQDAVTVTYEPLPPPSPPELDLYPTAIEVTQGIQDLVARLWNPPTDAPLGYNGAVPLVAGKATLVRLYGRAANVGAAVAGVPAELWGYRADNGAKLPGSPLQPVNGAITLDPSQGIDAQRTCVNGAWLFALPPSWTQAGAIRLHAMVNPGQSVAECDSCYNTGNRLNVPYVAFAATPDLHLYPFWACVRRSPGDPPGRCDVVSPLAPFDLLNSRDSLLPLVLPVANIDLHFPANPVIRINGDFASGGAMTAPRASALLGEVAYRRYADHVGGIFLCYDTLPGSGPGCFTMAENHVYLGLFPIPDWRGLARADRYAAVSAFDPARIDFSSSIAAEEVSHAIEFNWHTPSENCDQNPMSPSQSYPHYQKPDGTPYPRSSIGTWGFDPRTPYTQASLKDPDTTFDYMSYCEPAWSSPYTFRALHKVLSTGFTLGHDDQSIREELFADAPTVERVTANYVLVAGTIAGDDQAALDPIYQFTLPAGGIDAVSGSGPYQIQVRSVAGDLLAERRFELSAALAGVAAEAEGYFAELLPYPAGAAEVRIVHNGQVLAIRSASAHAPQVQLLAPAGGEQWPATGVATIAWTGSDGDGDEVFYTVQYSLDNGLSWQTLAEQLTSTTLEVDLARLAGATQARVRVLASDGLNTAMAQTASTFRVANKRPSAAILAPQAGATVAAYQPLLVQGMATDPEDGPLPAAQLSWLLDAKINLGRGPQIQVDHLTVGPHQLALRAEDSAGAPVTATVAFTATTPAYAVTFTQLRVDALCTTAATHRVLVGWQISGGGAGVVVDRIAVGNPNLQVATLAGPLPRMGTASAQVNLDGGDSATVVIRAVADGGAVATASQAVPLAHCLAPGLTVDRAPVEFGYVPISATHQTTLTLTNVGSLPLVLAGVDAPAQPFALTVAPSWPTTLAPGGNTHIGVSYLPLTEGPATAVLGVRLAAMTAQIALKGEGYPVPVEQPPAGPALFLPVIVR